MADVIDNCNNRGGQTAYQILDCVATAANTVANAGIVKMNGSTDTLAEFFVMRYSGGRINFREFKGFPYTNITMVVRTNNF